MQTTNPTNVALEKQRLTRLSYPHKWNYSLKLTHNHGMMNKNVCCINIITKSKLINHKFEIRKSVFTHLVTLVKVCLCQQDLKVGLNIQQTLTVQLNSLFVYSTRKTNQKSTTHHRNVDSSKIISASLFCFSCFLNIIKFCSEFWF